MLVPFAVLAWVCSLTFSAPTPVMLVLKWPSSLVSNLLSSLSFYLQKPMSCFFYTLYFTFLFCFVVVCLFFWFGLVVFKFLLFFSEFYFNLFFFSPLCSFWIFPGVEEKSLSSQEHINATIIEATSCFHVRDVEEENTGAGRSKSEKRWENKVNKSENRLWKKKIELMYGAKKRGKEGRFQRKETGISPSWLQSCLQVIDLITYPFSHLFLPGCLLIQSLFSPLSYQAQTFLNKKMRYAAHHFTF